MAHVAFAGSHGNRKNQHNRNFQAVFGLSAPRRSGSRAPLRSQSSGPMQTSSSGLPMGACGRAISASSGNSEHHPSQGSVTARCTLLVALRAVSVLAVMAGVLALACGLFMGKDGPIVWLCVVGAFMIFAVAFLWCALYVWYGKYCASGSAELSSRNGADVNSHRGTARSTTNETGLPRPANLDVTASYGPDTGMLPPHSPPTYMYSPIGQCVEQPPSTPPPPYHDIT